MSVLERIAFYKCRKDEVPNQELARELVLSGDTKAILEIVENLWNRNTSIRGDCIKVIYEIGFLKPELISDYYEEFLKLLMSRENRLVWGSMYALSTIAPLKADELFTSVPAIKKAMDQGSVITVDNGVKTLAGIASQKAEYQKEIVPYLIDHLRKCRTKEVPQHAESTMVAISGDFTESYRQVLEQRLGAMTPSQAQRITRILRKLG